ncbi:MAG: YifB family Mg chelatase-like AAA ATPase [Clostridiales bacterium]|nr:YifB family Mg chelatase-like AAA ATPase [Clostridiales bacterium]
MYSIVATAIIQGIRSIPVFVEADVSNGMPVFEMVGFLASEVKEAKERVKAALRNSGYLLPPKHITINFTPADIRKSGAGFDLPVALAVLSASGILPCEQLKDCFVIGEVGLNGNVIPVHGVLPMVAEARERGIRRCIVPKENESEAILVAEMEVLGVESLAELLDVLSGKRKREETGPSYNIEETKPEKKEPDFSDIVGQKMGKRACEVAVSGMHNILMIGPPGAGKTMIATRIPSILPTLDLGEQMELSKIYSVCGLFGERERLMSERPFRAPHHTITAQGLSGGGSVPKPGEISLAHKGVLFLDELPEYRKNTLEILRQPMEEKVVRISRVKGSYEYPADFMLVAAMNPCHCGYYPDMQKCRCTQRGIVQYLGKISRPLIDRIDVCVELPKVEFRDLNRVEEEESSAAIRERVMKTRKLQQKRYEKESFCFNSQLSSSLIKKYCRLTKEQEEEMEEMYHRLNLTARSYHKILKVARTLADMEQMEEIQDIHLREAVCYRSPDKRFWERE